MKVSAPRSVHGKQCPIGEVMTVESVQQDQVVVSILPGERAAPGSCHMKPKAKPLADPGHAGYQASNFWSPEIGVS